MKIYLEKMKNILVLFFLIFMIILHPCIAKTTTNATIVNDILHDVNIYRQQHGLNELVLKTYLSTQAERHSRNMATHIVPFGHTGFLARFKTIYRQAWHPNGAAENVAYNYKDGHDVVRNWLKSSHHLANIKGSYNYTGIGLARDKRGKLYFTQIFLRAA